ncbi:MAG TPA: ATP-binding cassette domain-containing protein [Candidatus Saccharibacteria bacterium]|nr:ATP-binding cassette domain-containing protein [Candidatus Saccharibacteria bacterium]HRQ06792.1 ATP-binding cassette domain-containing protein [Candidatus Saccharibacteria bacterium]
MIADISISEKSFGPKILMSGIKFSIDDHEKIGVIGRNGIGKSTLFGILAGIDKDFTGNIIYKRGVVVVSTAQEHHDLGDTTVLQYVLAGLPEYSNLSRIIETYPEKMGDNMKLIDEYTQALTRFDDKGFYQIEEQIERELDKFQLPGVAHRPFSTLSGGQKRLVEVVKVMHSDANLALVDEPTNHMDYIAKQQYIDWMKTAREAMLVITHDRDVLSEVDRIIELKDGENANYKGNYDAYLKQNAVSTGTQMNDFEMIEKRIVNLKAKVIDYQRLKEKSRNPGTIQKFKRLEENSRKELAELQAKEKPTFWIDKESAANLNYKVANQYDKFKAKNIRMNLKNDESRSKHVLVTARDVSLGYGNTPLFSGVNIDLREGEALEFRGRNGAGKTTLIKALLYKPESDVNSFSKQTSVRQDNLRLASLSPAELPAGQRVKQSSTSNESSRKLSGNLSSVLKEEFTSNSASDIALFSGEINLDTHVRIGIYEQEVSPTYFEIPLELAIERVYLDRGLSISQTKIRNLMSDYLFTEADGKTPVSRLSGGQKARLQLISMLANDPQLLILDEPTNHLDLPSIEELETALAKYSGAVIYVSHDGYFRRSLGGDVLQIGEK